MEPDDADRTPTTGRAAAGAPSDNTTLRDVLVRLAGRGWAGQLWVVEAPDGAPTEIECGTCRARVSPGDLGVDSLRRLEGASDPDDQLAVVAATCPRCGVKGVLVSRYGPEAGVHDTELLLHVAHVRGNASEGQP